MTEIQTLIEGTNVVLPDYANHTFSQERIEKQTYRTFVSGTGGTWDEGGASQLDFLKKRGLKTNHRFIDIGCGALRAGRHLVDYLDEGNYYGVDANRELLQIGYDRELTEDQRGRLPVANLRANDRFNVDFGVKFDMAIAQSVFTHVSLNHMRLCLHRLARVMRPGGVFYASYVDQPESTPIDHIFQKGKGGRTYFYEKNVFWYHLSDMEWAADDDEWSVRFVGDYGSAQQQLMVAYTRLSDAGQHSKAANEKEVARRRAAVNERIKAGGAASALLRARRKAATILNPYGGRI
jgi:SAM-dependent methyltransferase